MAKKEILWKGKGSDELSNMDMKDFLALVPSRTRRSLKRGFTDQQKKFLLKVKKVKDGNLKRPIKTHCRDMLIIPEMLGVKVLVYNGKEFLPLDITHEMLGKYLGEFTVNRKKVAHSAPGIGATKSSSAMSVK